MAVDSDDPRPSGKLVLPDLPGDHVLSHDGALWKKTAFAQMSAKDYGVVAETGIPPALAEIIDDDLDDYPMLAITHRDYERRKGERNRIAKANHKNAMLRQRLTLSCWNELFAGLHLCCKANAPLLMQVLYDACDLTSAGYVGGYFDGPRAWRIIKARISSADDTRSKHDKNYYRACLNAQLANRLPGGAPAAEFTRRAMAYVLYIMPNLAQKYTLPDAADYILDLMPKTLHEAGRRVKAECKAAGNLHDLQNLITLCDAEMFELQDPKVVAPLVTLAGAVVLADGTATDEAGYSLAMMCETTGIGLRAGGRGGHPAFAGVGNEPKSYCPKCPHPRGLICFCSPDYTGPPPPSVMEDKVRWNGFMAERDRHAAAEGRTAPRVLQPSKESIAKYKEVKAKRDKARKEGGARRGAGGAPPAAAAGGVAAPGGNSGRSSVDDFFGGIVDVTAVAMIDEVDTSEDEGGVPPTTTLDRVRG